MRLYILFQTLVLLFSLSTILCMEHLSSVDQSLIDDSVVLPDNIFLNTEQDVLAILEGIKNNQNLMNKALSQVKFFQFYDQEFTLLSWAILHDWPHVAGLIMAYAAQQGFLDTLLSLFDTYDNTPLMRAIQNNRPEIAAQMLTYLEKYPTLQQLVLCKENNQKQTAFLFAASAGDPLVLQVFFKLLDTDETLAKKVLEQKDTDGSHVLIYAVHNASGYSVRTILQKCSRFPGFVERLLTESDIHKNSPLTIAVELNSLAAVQAIIACVNQTDRALLNQILVHKNNKNKTARMIAQEEKNYAIMAELRY